MDASVVPMETEGTGSGDVSLLPPSHPAEVSAPGVPQSAVAPENEGDTLGAGIASIGTQVQAALPPANLPPQAHAFVNPELREHSSLASRVLLYSDTEEGVQPPRLSFPSFLDLPSLLQRIVPDIWKKQFISSRGNEYFCEIDEEYLTDRFNLTGLNAEVPYYQYALDLITDVFDLDADDHLRDQIEKSANHLYGLVHARYIVTTRGLAKMVRGYWKLVLQVNRD